jgi:hypothetical protein
MHYKQTCFHRQSQAKILDPVKVHVAWFSLSGQNTLTHNPLPIADWGREEGSLIPDL